MGISEAMSESWASILSRMWNPTQGPLTGVLIDRLRLHVNGYRGLTSDEHIVDLVAKHLPSLKPYRAHRSVVRGPHAQHGRDSSALFIARSEQDPNASALGAVMLQSEMARTFAAEFPVGATVSLTQWREATKLHHQQYDRASLGTSDIQVLMRCTSGNTPALPLHVMSKPQRAKWDIASVNRSVRDAQRRETLATRGKRATPGDPTSPVAKGNRTAARPGTRASSSNGHAESRRGKHTKS